MRVIVTGSRGWTDRACVYAALNAVQSEYSERPLVIVHGAAHGADMLAAQWTYQFDPERIYQERHPAAWGVDGKKAGPLRNQRMIDAGADLVLAFRCPGRSPGTDDMVRRAEKAGIPVRMHIGMAA